MRCEECGRVVKNAEMWQLGGDIHAPTSRSMRQLCWECRERAAAPSIDATSADRRTDALMAQVYEIMREYESGSNV